MSSGRLHEFDACAGPTGRFGLRPTREGYGGKPERLDDPEVVRAWLDELPGALGMNELIQPCLIDVSAPDKKDPGGVTSSVLVAASQFSVHASPRRRFVSAGVCSCRDHPDQERICRSLIATFELGKLESSFIPHSMRYPLVGLDGEPLIEASGSG